MTFTPRDGLDRCDCGSKYWDGDICHSCGEKCSLRLCEQNCTEPADCYAMGPLAGDWGGWYCYRHAEALGFGITEHINKKAQQ